MGRYTVEEKRAYFWEAFHGAHSGTLDMEEFRNSEYGKEIDRLSTLRFRFEEDPVGEDCLAFYRELGIAKKLYHPDDFYDRYAVFCPIHIRDGERLPVVFWNHGGGNPIEVDEFSVSLPQMVNKERFILVMLQNTNWESLLDVLEYLPEEYPIDTERIYAMGYSQGGQTVHSAALRIPERLAAVVSAGTEAFGFVDNLNCRYTLEEMEHMMHRELPVMEMTGSHEFLNFLPMNEWRPVRKYEGGHGLNLYIPQGHTFVDDPTNPPNNGRPDKILPIDGVDKDRWKLERMNLRLKTAGCDPLSIERCMEYRKLPKEDSHRWMGFYGEREEERMLYGKKHCIYDFFNARGINMFRYVGVEKSPHWPPLMLGELGWEFVRRFRRDKDTKRIEII